MPTGLRRQGGSRKSSIWPTMLCIGAGLVVLATMFVTVARAERLQPTERVIIFSCADYDQVTCPLRLMTRYNEWTAMHPSYFITGRQASIGVAGRNERGHTEGYLHTMSLSVFYINKHGD